MYELNELTLDEINEINIEIPVKLLCGEPDDLYLFCFIAFLEKKREKVKTTIDELCSETNMFHEDICECLHRMTIQGKIHVSPYHPNGVFDKDEILTIKTLI